MSSTTTVTPLKLVKYEIPESARTYKPNAPFQAKVIVNERLTEENSSVDIRNIVLDLSGSGIQYLEGQSIGVIPPGTQADGRPHRVRLYSIASARTGEDGSSASVTLCVKRVLAQDEQGQEIRGVASNYLCDLKAGDSVSIIGPSGRTFFLPQDDSVNLILIAAGTGIAPFRAFIQRIYRDKKSWSGKVRLFFGARNGMESIYMNRKNDDIGQYMSQETFEAFQAFSHADKSSPKVYVQDQVAANQEDVCSMIDEGNFSLYLCGMKAMEQGVEQVFRQHAERSGRNWDELKARFKAEGRWNIETY
ncbi:MAG TPA: FAD-binding oxidoreductase [Fibrobacteraceae bacterium]|nr:FAD-binding oxidoreductase [Fibrobacteraceae bacterium]